VTFIEKRKAKIGLNIFKNEDKSRDFAGE